MKAFYVFQHSYSCFWVMDYYSKMKICEVNMADPELAERWANRIAKALNEMMPGKL